jgi:hypothetical protein
MGGKSRKIKKTGLLIATGLTVAAGAAFSQEGGLNLSGYFGESLEFSDNPDFIADPTGTTLRSVTSLGFGLESITAADALSLDAGVSYRFTIATSSDTQPREGFFDPFVNLAYGRSTSTASLSFDASYSESDTGNLDFVLDPDSQDLVVDEGTVARTTLGFGLETGIGGPFGIVVDAGYSRRVYFDTLDPDLTDDETLTFFGLARFAVTPTTDANLIARYIQDRDFDGDDYRRTTTRLGAGFDHSFTETQRLGFDVTSDVIDTSENGVTETDEGYSFILGYEQDLQAGSFSVEASSVLENVGNQNTISFTRGFDLPDGALFFLLGVTNNDSSDLNPVLQIDYTRNLGEAVLSATARQSVDQSTTDNDEFLNRLVNVDYSQAINSVSGWQTSFGFNESENLTAGGTERQTNFTISYNRALTEDWDVIGGYQYRDLQSTTETDRTSNTFFLTLERDFAVRP